MTIQPRILTEQMLNEYGKRQSDGIYIRPDDPGPYEVHIETIVPGRWQPRREFDRDELNELAASIKAHGIKNPIRVFINEHCKFELIAGERRLRAAKLAELDCVPILIEDGHADTFAIDSVMDNLQRADLNPAEEGAAFEQLIAQQGISEAELSRMLGKSRGYIQQRRAIAQASPALIEHISAGALSLTHGRIIAQGAAGCPAAQDKATHEVKKRAKTATVSEADVRDIVNTCTHNELRKQLEELGWKTNINREVWSGSTPPETWTAQQIIQAVAEGKKPEGDEEPANGTVTDDEWCLLNLKYHPIWRNTNPPWWNVPIPPEGKPIGRTWVSFSRIQELVAAVRADLETVRSQIAELGWIIEIRASTVVMLNKKNHAEMYCYRWQDIERNVASIQNGANVGTYTCDVCGQTKGWSEFIWSSEKLVCKICNQARRDEYMTGVIDDANRLLKDYPSLAQLDPFLAGVIVRQRYNPETEWYLEGKDKTNETIQTALAITVLRMLQQDVDDD